MAALQESVRKAQASRADTDADVHDLAQPKKTATAKKSAKKTPAKKTTQPAGSKKATGAEETAKKTTARRPRSA
ncbi:hypothetical protein [Streptomyces sp. AK04-3B]|uniref:hypothetical protein n=1 Tax=Streptomyces sp. AK04-3B TaxID=3028650 RepID=UPI0029A115BF|nr:hypothetical protein [Streptomyces sp. AK04-3B]MDX3803648.1 hypothetical protein [Streptomyces sp. AK04-3B]